MINDVLRVASYSIGGINLVSGDASKGLMLINSQRQIDKIENLEGSIDAGNEIMLDGFDAMENHLASLNKLTESGIKMNQAGFQAISSDINAVEQGIKLLGDRVVNQIFQQTIENRAFQNETLKNQKLTNEKLSSIEKLLQQNLEQQIRQTIALENPEQTQSWEKLLMALKTIKLFQLDEKREHLENALNLCKQAMDSDSFNEAAIFFYGKWARVLGIPGWKEMYLESKNKTIVELENPIDSQSNLATENAERLSIAASVDLIEDKEFKLFKEEFYPFAKKYCPANFLLDIEAFYFYSLCYENKEDEAFKFLQQCYEIYGSSNFYNKLLENPIVLCFDLFYVCIDRINKGKEQVFFSIVNNLQAAINEEIENQDKTYEDCCKARDEIEKISATFGAQKIDDLTELVKSDHRYNLFNYNLTEKNFNPDYSPSEDDIDEFITNTSNNIFNFSVKLNDAIREYDDIYQRSLKMIKTELDGYISLYQLSDFLNNDSVIASKSVDFNSNQGSKILGKLKKLSKNILKFLEINERDKHIVEVNQQQKKVDDLVWDGNFSLLLYNELLHRSSWNPIIDWGEIVDSMCAGHNKGTYAVNDDGEEIWLFTDGMNYSFSDWPEKFSSVKKYLNTLLRAINQDPNFQVDLSAYNEISRLGESLTASNKVVQSFKDSIEKISEAEE